MYISIYIYTKIYLKLVIFHFSSFEKLYKCEIKFQTANKNTNNSAT